PTLVTNSYITKTDNESNARSIASYKNNFLRQNSITSINNNSPDDDTPESFNSSEENNDNDISEPSTITSHTTRPSRSLIPVQLLATRSSNIVEVDNSKADNDVS
ncbi:9306_t:CDS:2, partial [Racocetra persica]